jgi:hypothetical protein
MRDPAHIKLKEVTAEITIREGLTNEVKRKVVVE